MESVEARVARGAEWLDRVSPGWEHEINLSDLELSCARQCVLGQVYYKATLACACDRSGFAHALYCDAVAAEYPWAEYPWPEEHGFERQSHLASEYDELQEAWISLIKERFNTGNLSDAISR